MHTKREWLGKGGQREGAQDHRATNLELLGTRTDHPGRKFRHSLAILKLKIVDQTARTAMTSHMCRVCRGMHVIRLAWKPAVRRNIVIAHTGDHYAMLNDNTDCSSLTQSEMDNAQAIVELCAPYYFNTSLGENSLCEESELTQGGGTCSSVSGLPTECILQCL